MTDEDHAPDSSDAMQLNKLGYAWLAVTLALVLHIIDEADYDFVAVYQPVTAIARDQAPFLPIPLFSFGAWLGGMAVFVLALFILLPLAFRGGRWIRGAAYVQAALMTANALTHCIAALHFNHHVPGMWSAMLLLVLAAWLFVAARRTVPGHHLPLSHIDAHLS